MAIPFGQSGPFSQVEPLKESHFLVVTFKGPLSIMTFNEMGRSNQNTYYEFVEL
jgi:hypothetical protein